MSLPFAGAVMITEENIPVSSSICFTATELAFQLCSLWPVIISVLNLLLLQDGNIEIMEDNNSINKYCLFISSGLNGW
jgi:hypothetical protein